MRSDFDPFAFYVSVITTVAAPCCVASLIHGLYGSTVLALTVGGLVAVTGLLMMYGAFFDKSQEPF